jgi:hypothetical protein
LISSPGSTVIVAEDDQGTKAVPEEEGEEEEEEEEEGEEEEEVEGFARFLDFAGLGCVASVGGVVAIGRIHGHTRSDRSSTTGAQLEDRIVRPL